MTNVNNKSHFCVVSICKYNRKWFYKWFCRSIEFLSLIDLRNMYSRM